MNLFKASAQWSNRPDDERFSTLAEMYAATRSYADNAREAVVPFDNIRVEADGEEVLLVGKAGIPATFSNFAFGQLAASVGAPAKYLQSLPPTLAAHNINHGLKKRGNRIDSNDAKLMFHENGKLVVRSLTTEVYQRVWNYEIVARLYELQSQGWRVPPARPAFENQVGSRPATADDVLAGERMSLSINIGDIIAPAGLYASDRNMFAFLINDNVRIEDGSEGGLYRGAFFENSEVGDGTIRRTTFLYRTVCGNHIVWGAKNVKEISLKHVGQVRNRFNQVQIDLREYANESASDTEAKILRAKQIRLGATKEEVLDFLFGKRVASRKLLTSAYDSAVENQDVDKVLPNSVYGMVQGLTRVSQSAKFADARTEADKAAGKVMQIAF